jgi:hypothetical protein
MAAPALNLPPATYDRMYFISLLNTLRLYFTGQVDIRDPVVVNLAGLETYATTTVNLGENSPEFALIDTTAGTVTVNLPAASTCTQCRFTVKMVVKAGANKVTVQAVSGNIDGAATKDIVTLYAGHTFKSDGTNWWIVSTIA